jgi:acyl-CoA reductase-like NAD-dependent aldehyde dehydrogenase
MSIEAVNPATGEVVATYDEMTAQAVAGIVDSAHAAFSEWRRASYADRALPMRRAGEILRRDAREFAHLMAREIG